MKWEGRVVRAGIERYRHADGIEVTRDKVWHPGAVGIVALDDEHVWLTRQPREVIGASASLEIPAGKLDVPGEPPLDTAQRELAEEIGKRAEHWEELFVVLHEPRLQRRARLAVRRDRAGGQPGGRRGRGRADRDRAVAAREAGRGDRRVRGLEVADRAAVAGGATRRRRGSASARSAVSINEEAARGFQQGADAYERGRPGYPAEAVRWLWHELGLGPGRTVLDVAAGTGKLTRELVRERRRPWSRSSRSRRCGPCSSGSCPTPARSTGPPKRSRSRTARSMRSRSPRRFTGSTARRPAPSSIACCGRTAGLRCCGTAVGSISRSTRRSTTIIGALPSADAEPPPRRMARAARVRRAVRAGGAATGPVRAGPRRRRVRRPVQLDQLRRGPARRRTRAGGRATTGRRGRRGATDPARLHRGGVRVPARAVGAGREEHRKPPRIPGAWRPTR